MPTRSNIHTYTHIAGYMYILKMVQPHQTNYVLTFVKEIFYDNVLNILCIFISSNKPCILIPGRSTSSQKWDHLDFTF